MGKKVLVLIYSYLIFHIGVFAQGGFVPVPSPDLSGTPGIPHPGDIPELPSAVLHGQFVEHYPYEHQDKFL